MSRGASGTPKLAYLGTLVLLALAMAFPVGLMVFNPTLMFERGWEQYAGTTAYTWAVLMLARELRRLWRAESAFREAPSLLARWSAEGSATLAEDGRLLPDRLRRLAPSISATRLMELNREASALDQEQMAGRFTLTRYCLYLLPIIGFIGTVEGISRALMNISIVLPMVHDLDGFLANLTGVTAALQIAFDSTLLALFLSSALMLVQTLVARRAEDLLGRVDRWVVDEVLPTVEQAEGNPTLAEALERLRQEVLAALERQAQAVEALGERLGGGMASQVERFSGALDRLGPALTGFQRGAESVGRLGDELAILGTASDALRKGAASLTRIEAAITQDSTTTDQLDEIRRGLDRAGAAIDALSSSWAHAFEKSSRATQEHLARTLNSLKDALDLLHVSMEQGNALYRSIVKKMFDDRAAGGAGDAARAA